MKKGYIIWLVVAATIAVLIVGPFVALTQWYVPKVRREASVQFQRDAILEVIRLTANTGWIEEKLASIPEIKWDDDHWFSQNLILMQNRDWIVYEAECTKSNWRVNDIFIGKGSDGRWYYTTYHFCVRMLELECSGPSPDLSSFIDKYSLREFNGDSSADLPSTWPESDD